MPEVQQKPKYEIRPKYTTEFVEWLRNGKRFYEREKRSRDEFFELKEKGNSGMFELYMNDRIVKDVICFITNSSIHRVNTGSKYPIAETMDLYFVEISFIE